MILCVVKYYTFNFFPAQLKNIKSILSSQAIEAAVDLIRLVACSLLTPVAEHRDLGLGIYCHFCFHIE